MIRKWSSWSRGGILREIFESRLRVLQGLTVLKKQEVLSVKWWPAGHIMVPDICPWASFKQLLFLELSNLSRCLPHLLS